LEQTAEVARDFWRPRFFTRDTYADWAAEGHDAAKIALRKAKELIETHEPEPLPSEVTSEIRRIMAHRLDADFVAAYFPEAGP
jgi:trimethylamine:corrinoid methyltransferase-like protein